MRRTIIGIGLFAVLALAGCEDGPQQTYNPSPSGAGKRWNNGATPSAVDPGKQGYTQDGGTGTNKQEICSGDEKAKRWAAMVKEPLVPAHGGGGIDLAGGDSWQGITIEEAEKINCQSVNEGDQFGDGTQVNQWGDNGEVWFDYRVSTHKGIFMVFWPGYVGTITAKSRDGKDTFVLPLQTQITKNGQPYETDYIDVNARDHWGNEIYDALLATFAPGLPGVKAAVDNGGDQSADCFASGQCVYGNFGDVAYMFWPAFGTAIWVDNENAPQPTPSKPTRLDVDLTKTLAFSLAPPLLKMDQVGPVAHGGTLGKASAPCDLAMGLEWKDFLGKCVQTTGDTSKDQIELNKLLGGLSHSTERFSFDVQGVDINFSDKQLPQFDIIHDQDVPNDGDIATEWNADQSTLGAFANDYPNNDPTPPAKKDLHGSGMVYLEYARLVQEDLNSFLPPAKRHQLGDPACLNLTGDPNFVPADGCTGFEGFVTAAPTAEVADPQMVRLALGKDAASINPNMALGLKPGHPSSTFCQDPLLDGSGLPDLANGYLSCVTGDIFSTSYAQVLSVLGQGKVANLPTDAQDVRFFFKAYFRALVKYLMVADSANATVDGVYAQKIDERALFFDSIGAGQFEIAEYVDRRFASKSVDPTDLVVTADVKNGIFDDYTFSRELYRGEETVYNVMLEDQNDGIGQEDSVLLTNVFGSPLLQAGWVASSAGKDAYYCATNMDPANCDGQMPPLDDAGQPLLDEAGQPLLTRYKGAFTGTAMSLGKTSLWIEQTLPNIQSAKVHVPHTTDPYDPSSAALPELTVLIPWLPKQPGVGFPVPLSGTLEKFVETAQLDFSGTTISANIDYQEYKTSIGANNLEFLAVETTDFLGDVFLCQDPATGSLLSARMYTPVANIIDWLAQHPSAYESCGIVIRYSPYGNYADYITSLTNGVRLGITQGGGYGRVVDVTLFVPGQ